MFEHQWMHGFDGAIGHDDKAIEIERYVEFKLMDHGVKIFKRMVTGLWMFFNKNNKVVVHFLHCIQRRQAGKHNRT